MQYLLKQITGYEKYPRRPPPQLFRTTFFSYRERERERVREEEKEEEEKEEGTRCFNVYILNISL